MHGIIIEWLVRCWTLPPAFHFCSSDEEDLVPAATESVTQDLCRSTDDRTGDVIPTKPKQ